MWVLARLAHSRERTSMHIQRPLRKLVSEPPHISQYGQQSEWLRSTCHSIKLGSFWQDKTPSNCDWDDRINDFVLLQHSAIHFGKLESV